MFIRNLNGSTIPIYSCNNILGEYLVNQKSIPVLSIENGKWLFSKTHLLEEVLNGLPFYMKIIEKF
jgi:hypothetical protein